MAFAIIGTVGAGSTTGTSVTTGALNTTGANSLVAIIGNDSAAAVPTITDNNGHTWQLIGSKVNGAIRVTMYTTGGGTMGAGHTFTVPASTASHYPSVEILAVSHANDFSYDILTSAASGTPGSITPGGNDALIVTGVGVSGIITLAINAGYTLDTAIQHNAQHYGSGIGHIIQVGAPTAASPTWSGGGTLASMQVSFLDITSYHRYSQVVAEAASTGATQRYSQVVAETASGGTSHRYSQSVAEIASGGKSHRYSQMVVEVATSLVSTARFPALTVVF